jgi:hypothetical protein
LEQTRQAAEAYGHRIALATARELLDEIKLGFELAFQTGITIV